MKKAPTTRKRRRRQPDPRTFDEAAVLLLQLDAGQVEDLRVLSRGLRAIAAEVGLASVRDRAIAAADAVDAAIELSGDAAAAQLATAGRELEAAMAAVDDSAPPAADAPVAAPPPADASIIAPAAHSTAAHPERLTSAAVLAPDPMAWALEAIAALDAEEARGGTSTAAPSHQAAGASASPACPLAVNGLDPAAELGDTGDEAGSLPPDADLELLDGFVTESAEYLQGAEAALLELEANPGNTEAVNTIFRCFHTIKGTAAFMGLERLSELAHRAESLLSRVRDGEIVLAGGYADLALRSADALGEMVASVRASLGGAPLRVPAGYACLMRDLADPDAAIAAAVLGAAGAPAPSPTGGPTDLAEAMASAAGITGAAADGPGNGAALRPHDASQDSWMRVRTDRVDRLVDTIGELVIAHSMIAQDEEVAVGRGDDLARKVAHAGKIVRELQDLSISMRMVPLKAQFQKLARVVRDVAVKSGKRVEFVTEGEETEIDRNMVDIIGDPLIHMIRNAVDHGLETPEERVRAGKSGTGTIRLSAFHAGGAVVVQLRDDGRGLDREKILAKAVSRGLVEPDRHLSEREIDALIFLAGFSTAEQVTDLSGRGVGMDVVRRNIESLRGHVDIESRTGRGITFTIRLPLTLALTDGMLVRIGRERYIIPTTSIQKSFRPTAESLSTVVGRGELVMLRGELLPIVRMHRLFNVRDAVQRTTDGLLVIIAAGEHRCALLIDELLGQQQVVTKSLGAGIGKVAGLSGGAILGDGRVGLIVDPGELIALSRNATPVESAA